MNRKKNSLIISILILGVTLVASDSARADWAAGVAAFEGGDFATAAGHFEALVEGNPDEPQSRYMLAESLQRMGRSAEALGHLRRAHEIDPKDVRIATGLGKTLLAARDYAEAAEVLGSVDVAGLPAAHRLLVQRIRGEALYRAGQFDAAVRDLRELAVATPDDAEFQLLFGVAALKAGELELGLPALAVAARLRPDDRAKQLTFARALMQQAASLDGTERTAAYRQAIGVLASSEKASPSYETTMLRVAAELDAGLYRDAALSAERASSSPDAEWTAFYSHGQALALDSRWQEAEPTLVSALGRATKGADRTKVSAQLALVYEKLKKWDLAIELYTRVGDREGVARADHNREIEEYNLSVDEHNARRAQIERELQELAEQIDNLGSGPRR